MGLSAEEVEHLESGLKGLRFPALSERDNLAFALNFLGAAIGRFRASKRIEKGIPTLGRIGHLLTAVLVAGKGVESSLDRCDGLLESRSEISRFEKACRKLARALRPFGDRNPYGPRAFLSTPPMPTTGESYTQCREWVRGVVCAAERSLSLLYVPRKETNDPRPPRRVVVERSPAFRPWATRDLVVDCLVLWEKFEPGRASASENSLFRDFVFNTVYSVAMRPLRKQGEADPEGDDDPICKRQVVEIMSRWRAMRGLPRKRGRPAKGLGTG